MGAKRLTDIDVCIHHERELAVKVSLDGEEKNAVWLPKSAIEIERMQPNHAMITLPEQLALDKGLI